MWDVYCEECGRWELIGIRGTVAVVNVEPGVMVVTLRCGRGHHIRIATGRGTDDPGTLGLAG